LLADEFALFPHEMCAILNIRDSERPVGFSPANPSLHLSAAPFAAARAIRSATLLGSQD
jgi:hypothetical protein